MAQAKVIATTRAIELAAKYANAPIIRKKDIDVTDWMQSYIHNYTKKDVRIMQATLNRFIDYLKKIINKSISFKDMDPLLIDGFIDYLNDRSIGEGANSYYSRFKKMLRHAYRLGLLEKDITQLTNKKAKGKARPKDFLTIEEIETLLTIPISNLNVKNGAIFSLMTGLRWVDIKALKWENINLKDKTANIQQLKTGEYITIQLNDTAISVIGDDGKGLVFDLPSANGTNKALKAWVKSAGITKAITWHNLRHSTGTNLAINGIDLLTISRTLGHSTTAHTLRYAKTVDAMKRNAVDGLNLKLQ